MKKSEVAMIILIASVSVMVAFLVANNIPALKVDNSNVKVKVVDTISPALGAEPSPEIFNSYSINPTVKTEIGDGS